MEVSRSIKRFDLYESDLRFLLSFADVIRIRRCDTGYEIDVVFIEETEYIPADLSLFEQAEEEETEEEEEEQKSISVSADRGNIIMSDEDWKELTDKAAYRIVKDQFILGSKKESGKYTVLLCRPLSKLDELHKLLEWSNSSKEIKFYCDSIGLKINDGHVTYLMRLLAELYDDCELKEGHPLILKCLAKR